MSGFPEELLMISNELEGLRRADAGFLGLPFEFAKLNSPGLRGRKEVLGVVDVLVPWRAGRVSED